MIKQAILYPNKNFIKFQDLNNFNVDEGCSKTLLADNTLVIENTVIGRAVWRTTDSIGLKIGKTYTLSAYVRSDTPQRATLEVYTSAYFDVDTEWKRISHTNLISAISGIAIKAGDNLITGRIYVKDIQLEESATATSFIPYQEVNKLSALVNPIVPLQTDFNNKVASSVVVNPNKAYRDEGTALLTPAQFVSEFPQVRYDEIKSLNGVSYSHNSLTNTKMAQVLFSFNIIEILERKFGSLGNDLTEKVTKARTLLKSWTINWHGYGSANGSNKCSLRGWNGSSWVDWTVGHTSGSIVKLQLIYNGAIHSPYIGTDGFFHCVAFAEPYSTVASSINTDYVELILNVANPTNQNKPIISQSKPAVLVNPIVQVKSDFNNKIYASVVENPNKSMFRASSTLTVPALHDWECSQVQYDRFKLLDSTVFNVADNVNSRMSQQLFSFNVIEILERRFGSLGSTLAEKIAKAKEIVKYANPKWYGYGSSPTGNKANFTVWQTFNSSWAAPYSHSISSVSQISYGLTSGMFANRIDTNGFVHVMAYAEISNGTVASVINTDYVELILDVANPVNQNKPVN